MIHLDQYMTKQELMMENRYLRNTFRELVEAMQLADMQRLSGHEVCEIALVIVNKAMDKTSKVGMVLGDKV